MRGGDGVRARYGAIRGHREGRERGGREGGERVGQGPGQGAGAHLRVEERDELRRHELVEAFQEGVGLLADRRGHAVVRHQAHVLVLVLVRHGDVAPVRH
jgi:hypothetical protein